VITKLQQAADLLDTLDPYERPKVGELYELGEAVRHIIDHLRSAVRVGMAQSVEELVEAANVADPADTPVYDDAGGHPQDRLRSAGNRLQELDARLAGASAAASEYHSAIGHIGDRSTS